LIHKLFRNNPTHYKFTKVDNYLYVEAGGHDGRWTLKIMPIDSNTFDYICDHQCEDEDCIHDCEVDKNCNGYCEYD
jgi:hypothetical protein